MSRLLIIFILLLTAIRGQSQVHNTDLDSLLTQYAKSKMDTNRVKILLQLDTLYIFERGGKAYILDSALLLAKGAKELSAALHFTQGYDDANFLLARAFRRKDNIPAVLNTLKDANEGSKVHILIVVGEYYAFRPGQLTQNLDSAYTYISEAMRLSNSMKSAYWQHQSLCLLGKYYYERGEFDKGRDCFLKIIYDYQTSGDKAGEAFWWEEFGIYMPDTDETYPYEVNAYQNARLLFRQLGNVGEEKSVISNLGYIYQRHGNLDSATYLFLNEIALEKKLGRKNLSVPYSNLAEISLSTGNYNSSIFYSMEAINYLDSSAYYSYAGVIYFHLAEAYRELSETDKSLQWYTASLNSLESEKAEYLFAVARRISGALITKGKPAEALSFLQHFIKHNDAPRYADKEMFAAAMGDCYNALQQYKTAEQYYLQMIAVDSLANKQRIKEIFGVMHAATIYTSDANYIIGKFYVERGQYQVAGSYLNNALVKDFFNPSLIQLRDIHMLIFKVDSAKGNYIAAIKEYQTGKLLNDSVFTIAKSKQIQELQAKYDVSQKQKEVQVLQAKAQVQNKELQRFEQARYFTYIIVLILIALIGIGYSRYRVKQKSNKQLAAKQEEINQKNAALEHLLVEKDELITDKDILLEEKEWLLKEVHHRVKNNLQIVISLLNTQSKFLDNKEAKAAFAESRHRMQAMSLIHQKLYQSENAGTVDMHTYVKELADYLQASFQTNKSIHFNIRVDNIELDIAQAIPIGLLLNEAITNAIKYAFKNVQGGVISITMTHRDEHHILLKIQDNGKGADVPFETTHYNTMGFRLMKGLAKQLGGDLIIYNEGGVTIVLEFIADNFLKSIASDVKQKTTVVA